MSQEEKPRRDQIRQNKKKPREKTNEMKIEKRHGKKEIRLGKTWKIKWEETRQNNRQDDKILDIKRSDKIRLN